jgi:hypothetical protein
MFLLKNFENTRRSGWPKYIYGVGWLDGQTCMEMAVAGWQSGPILCCANIMASSWLAVRGCPLHGGQSDSLEILITRLYARDGNSCFKMNIIFLFERDIPTSSERKYQFYNRRHCRSRCKLSKTHLIFNNEPLPYIIIQAYTKIKRLKTLQDMIVLDWSPNSSVFKIVKCV